MIGKRLGRYEIVEKIGEGGMGEVYLARDLRLDREVAVKVLPPSVLADEQRRARFKKEALSLSRLNHPNIAIVHDFDTQDGVDFLVMEYVRGAGLDERLKRGALPEEEVVRLGLQLAAGLEAAHREGIVHRDLKPANLRITEDGRLKILDFGLAKLIEPIEESEATRTGTGPLSVMGTLPYMAPEQLRAGEVDARTDVFAAGAVLYEATTGRRAHPQQTTAEIIDAVLNREPDRPTSLSGAASKAVERVVLKALRKDPAERYQSAAELGADLRCLAPGGSASTAALLRRPWFLAAVVVLALVLGTLGMWQVRRAARIRWAREEALPRIERLIEEHTLSGDGALSWQAFRLAEEARGVLGEADPRLASLRERFTIKTRILSEPPGARVLVQPYAEPDAAWWPLGTTPLEGLQLPSGFSRLRVELDGYVRYDTIFRVLRADEPGVSVELHETGTVPAGMVWIAGSNQPLRLPGLESLDAQPVAGFWADMHEVTNGEYKKFVDAGGYHDPTYWKQPIVVDGRELAFDAAMALFRDRAGQPGPATWEVGDHPEGAAELPVGGVSWYEAAAYAEFVGKQLPTVFHWNNMAFPYAGQVLIPASNFAGRGPTPVGSRPAIHVGGTRDLAGNVREWCINASSRSAERFILGGGWNDPPYAFNDAYAQPALDRSETNGFRCITSAGQDGADGDLARKIELPFRDFFAEQPVDERTYRLFLSQFAYDKTDLRAVIESERDAEDWSVQRISFDAAYGDEKVTAFLFLPKGGRATPPYQTLVIFPGSGVIHQRGSETVAENSVPSFILKSGRAVLFPVYKGTLDRGGDLTTDQPSETNRYRDYVRMWAQDLMRSVDYVETRADIDASRLAYWGVSWGGRMAPLMLAVEPRFRTAVLTVAGLKFQRALPEVDPFNYITRVRVPVLMMNGRYDFFFPLETSQRPMYELFGTAAPDKRWVVYDDGHSVPRAQQIQESLAWLDRFLGPVN